MADRLGSPARPDVAQPRPWLAAGTLATREVVRFVRQRNRLIGAVGQPVLFWLLFSAGLGPSFRLPSTAAGVEGTSFAAYFFPGTLALILLFTAIFATISIIEDRREGFLQSVLVAPLPRWSCVLGKLIGGTIIALAQGLLFLALGFFVDVSFSVGMVLSAAAFMALLAFALTGLGFAIAWRMDSTQGFHAIMSVFLMPMWLLSGAFFPADARAGLGAAALAWVMRANPLTYGVAGLRCIVDPAQAAATAGPSLGVCWLITFAFAAVTFGLSCQAAGGRTTGDLL